MKTLIIISWATPFLAIPFYFFALVGWGMSATSGPHATIGEIIGLAIGPCISLFTIGKILSGTKNKGRKVAGLLVPGLLSLAELGFTFMVWSAG